MSSIARQDAGQPAGFWSSLFSSRFYKASQGRMARQVTFLASGLVAVLTAWALGDWMGDVIRSFMVKPGGPPPEGLMANLRTPLAVAFGAIGIWTAFRLVNYPKFADFLIAVEAEMNKVTWPKKGELWRASCVVIFVIFFLSMLLFLFDIFWTGVFTLMRVRY